MAVWDIICGLGLAIDFTDDVGPKTTRTRMRFLAGHCGLRVMNMDQSGDGSTEERGPVLLTSWRPLR